MTKVHTIPLHIGDLLASTIGLDATEFGAFVSLLIAHYQAGEDGLPADEKTLARLSRLSDKRWKRIRGEIVSRFEWSINPGRPDQPRMVNRRCQEVIKWIHDKSAQNSANALKGWAAPDANAKQWRRRRNSIQNPKPFYP